MSTIQPGTVQSLSFLDYIAYLPVFFFGPVNVMVSLISMYFSVKQQRILHKNFVILRFMVLFAFVMVAGGHTVFSMMGLMGSLSFNSDMPLIVTICIIIVVFGSDLIRLLFLFILLERTIATFRSRFYEQNQHPWIGIWLTFFAVSFAGCIVYYKMKEPLIIANAYFINLIFDVISCITVYFLRNLNRRMRQINARSDIILTQRFQITENIRILRMISPIVVLGIVVSVLGSFGQLSFRLIPVFYQFYSQFANFYFLIFNIYIFLSFCLYFYNEQKFKFKIFKIGSKVHPIHNVVENVNGENLIHHQTVDEYFKNVQNSWNMNFPKKEQQKDQQKK